MFLLIVREVNVPFSEKLLLCIFDLFKVELTYFFVRVLCIRCKMTETMEDLINIAVVNVLLMMLLYLLKLRFEIILLFSFLLTQNRSCLWWHTTWKRWSWTILILLRCSQWIQSIINSWRKWYISNVLIAITLVRSSSNSCSL